MFDIRRQVKLKQARHALRDGRLDEAFAIVCEKDVRDHRGGQALLEQLLDPLLRRAAEHLQGQRYREALIDVERALVAGGNQPRTTELRQEIQKAIQNRDRKAEHVHHLLDSVRRHLANGSLKASQERLEQLGNGAPEAAALARQVEDRDRKGRLARDRAVEHVKAREPLLALDAVGEAQGNWGHHEEIAPLLPKLQDLVVPEIERAIHAGDLKLAGDLSQRLRTVVGQSLESRRFDDVLGLASQAARCFQSGDYEELRVLLGRLQKSSPKTSWVKESLQQLDRLSEALRSLRTGPLGTFDATFEPRLAASVVEPFDSGRGTNVLVGAPTQAVPPADAAASDRRLLLWIDGVGTYLILTGDQLSLGRQGSTARADIALNSDLAGYHAEILRLEDDYFVVAAQGDVAVGGRSIQRKLLSDGDSLELGARCRLSFRLPTSMASTAVLTLRKGLRVEGDARDVVLLDKLLLIGRGDHCHVPAAGPSRPVVLMRRDGGLYCRAEEEIEVEGRPQGREAPVPLGAHVQVGELTFTVTPARRPA